MVKNLMNGKYAKYFAAAAGALMICVLMVGCMNTNPTTPNVENSMLPQNSVMPGTQNNTEFGNGTMNNVEGSLNGMNGSVDAPIFDWLNMGRSVEDKINMLSEIDQSRIVVNDGTALVGVQFTGQYQGELTQRIRDMVAGEIMAADSGIRTVAVTAEPEDVQKINQMADQIAAGTPAQNFKAEIDSIVRNVTTLQ